MEQRIDVYEDSLKNLADSSMVNDSTSYRAVVNKAIILNKFISPSNTMASNYVLMNDIYLNMLKTGVDTFTTDQVSQLSSLANLCPYAGGDAVYMARTLYAMVDNSAFYDDSVLCPDAGGDRSMLFKVPNDTTQQAPAEMVMVYPNPAHTVLNLAYFAQTTGTVDFELIDQLGQLIMQQEVAKGINFERYDIGSINSGVYHWRLRDSQRIIKSDKLVIIK